MPASYLLLVAVHGVISDCESLRDLKLFARRHHVVLGKELETELRRPPSDLTFQYFFLQVVVVALCTAIRDWTVAQITGGANDLEQLVCDGKMLGGSIEPTAGGGSAFIVLVTLRSTALDVAITQACSATGENHERAVLKRLICQLVLEGVLIQQMRCTRI
jgi:hypothetical protein